MAVAQTTVNPWVGPPATVIDITVPTWTAIDFHSTTHVYLAPQALPPGLAPGTTFFGYPQDFQVIDDHHLTMTVSAIGTDPLKGLVRGHYGIIIVSAIDSMNAGTFLVLRPGENINVPPPGADFVNFWPGPYIPDWKPGGYSGFNAPPGWSFWYDSPEHPCTDLQYWWDMQNWGSGSWKWVSLPSHPPQGWSIQWDGNSPHGPNTSLHGWVLVPDDPQNPAPGVTWPPWPTVAPPPGPPPPPAQPPSTAALPPKNPNAPAPAAPPAFASSRGGPGGPVGGAGAPPPAWPGLPAPSNAGRMDALYFFSDLHVGDGSLTEDFVESCAASPTLNDRSWMALIDWVRRDSNQLRQREVIQGARIVLNGDCIDLWGSGPTPGDLGPGDVADYQTRLANILLKHKAFLAALNQFLSENDHNKLIILPGNHDEALLRFARPLMDDFCASFGANTQRVFAGNALPTAGRILGYVDDGFVLVAEHGNAYDPDNFDLNDVRHLFAHPPARPVLMMPGQVLVEEFVNWMEMGVLKAPTDPALKGSLLLVDNTQTPEEFGKYMVFHSSATWAEVYEIAMKLRATLSRSGISPAANWVREVIRSFASPPPAASPQTTSAEFSDLLKGLTDSHGDDLAMVGRAPESVDQRLADAILSGQRGSGAPAKPLIAALGHTHERVWRNVGANGFPQLHFNTNTWMPKYAIDTPTKSLLQIPDSYDEPQHPVVRVVAHPKFAPGSSDPTDPFGGVVLMDDVNLKAPPPPTGPPPNWEARASYLRLPSTAPSAYGVVGPAVVAPPPALPVEVVEVGFTGDHMLTEWLFNQRIDDPDGSAPTWKKTNSPDLPVAYTRGTPVTMFVTLQVANWSNPPQTIDIRASNLGTVIASASGVLLNAPLVVVGGITSQIGMVTSVTVTTPVFDWEISYDQGQTWQPAGRSGRHTIYWTYDKPLSPPFADRSGAVYDPLYDEALSRACRYVAGETAVPDIVRKLAEGVDNDIWYSPWTLITGHPLNAYAKGRALCWDNATLLRGLCRSLGIDATVKLFWGGQPNQIVLYAQQTNPRARQSFRVTAPKHDDAALDPHFRYHAMVEVNGTLYDPSYGVVRPNGLTVSETAQSTTGASYPTQTGLTLPFGQWAGWVCPH